MSKNDVGTIAVIGKHATDVDLPVGVGAVGHNRVGAHASATTILVDLLGRRWIVGAVSCLKQDLANRLR